MNYLIYETNLTGQLPFLEALYFWHACLLLLLSRATPATVPANLILSASHHRGQTLEYSSVVMSKRHCWDGKQMATYGNIFFQILWDVWSWLWSMTSVITRVDRQVSRLHTQCSTTGTSKEALILFKAFFLFKNYVGFFVLLYICAPNACGGLERSRPSAPWVTDSKLLCGARNCTQFLCRSSRLLLPAKPSCQPLKTNL